MTAGLVAVIWTVAEDQLQTLFRVVVPMILPTVMEV